MQKVIGSPHEQKRGRKKQRSLLAIFGPKTGQPWGAKANKLATGTEAIFRPNRMDGKGNKLATRNEQIPGISRRGGGRRAGPEAIFGLIREHTLPAITISNSHTNRSDIWADKSATCSAPTQSVSRTKIRDRAPDLP